MATCMKARTAVRAPCAQSTVVVDILLIAAVLKDSSEVDLSA